MQAIFFLAVVVLVSCGASAQNDGQHHQPSSGHHDSFLQRLGDVALSKIRSGAAVKVEAEESQKIGYSQEAAGCSTCGNNNNNNGSGVVSTTASVITTAVAGYTTTAAAAFIVTPLFSSVTLTGYYYQQNVAQLNLGNGQWPVTCTLHVHSIYTDDSTFGVPTYTTLLGSQYGDAYPNLFSYNYVGVQNNGQISSYWPPVCVVAYWNTFRQTYQGYCVDAGGLVSNSFTFDIQWAQVCEVTSTMPPTTETTTYSTTTST